MRTSRICVGPSTSKRLSCGSLVFLRFAKVSLRGMRRLVAKLAPRDFFAIPLLENCSMREAAVALSFAMGLPVIHNHNPRNNRMNGVYGFRARLFRAAPE